MPAIPRYNRQQTIPGQVADIEVAGQSGKAWGQLGEAISKSADKVEDHVLRLEKQKGMLEATELGAQAKDEARQFKIQLQQKKGQEAFGSQKLIHEWGKNFQEKYRAKAKSPYAKAMLQIKLSKIQERVKDFGASWEATQKLNAAENSLKKTYHATIVDVSDEASIPTSCEKYNEVVDTYIEHHLLSQQAGEALKVQFKHDAIKQHFAYLYDFHPEQAQKELQSGKYDKVFTQEEKNRVQQNIETAIKNKEKDEKKQKQQEEYEKQKQFKAEQEETKKDFLIQSRKGTLTYKQIDDSNLNSSDRSKFYKLVETRKQAQEKAIAEGRVLKTDPIIHSQCLQRLYLHPETITKWDIMEYNAAGKLDPKDTETLLEALETAKNKTLKTRQATTAFSRIEDGWKTGLYGNLNEMTPEQRKIANRRKAEDIISLQEWIINHPNENPNEFVDEILKNARGRYEAPSKGIFSDTEGTKYQSDKERQEGLRLEAETPSHVYIGTGQDAGYSLPLKIDDKGLPYVVGTDGQKHYVTRATGSWKYVSEKKAKKVLKEIERAKKPHAKFKITYFTKDKKAGIIRTKEGAIKVLKEDGTIVSGKKYKRKYKKYPLKNGYYYVNTLHNSRVVISPDGKKMPWKDYLKIKNNKKGK